MPSSFLLIYIADNAEANVAAPVDIVPLTIHSTATGMLIIVSMVQNLKTTATITTSIAPFPHIATHVVQAIAVRLFLRNWMSFVFTIILSPSNTTKIFYSDKFISLTVLCRILPLFQHRQAVAISILITFNSF